MRYILSFLFLAVSFTAQSQTYQYASLISNSNQSGIVKGIVLDDQNMEEGLAFASISVKNTLIETSTEIDGTFTLNLKPGTYTLMIEFIGYKSLEIPNVVVVANEIVALKHKLSPLKPSSSFTMLK
jgi:hypothetical protein